MVGPRDRDARAFAHFLRTDGEHFRSLAPETGTRERVLAAELPLTIRAFRDLVAEGVRLTNQPYSCLGDYYPVAVDLFGDLDAAISLDFLAAFSMPEAARTAGREPIVARLSDHRYSHTKRASQVAERATAKVLTAKAGAVRARSRRMLALVAELQTWPPR